MQSLSNETEPEIWPQIVPLLEDAMGRLGEKDRNVIALRFFEGKSFQEIGAAFNASENAAKKRAAHALEKLRKFFLKHGIASTTATLAVALSAKSVQAAPAMLAKTATAMALAKGATASVSTLTLINGALKIMAWTQAKVAIIAGIATILVAGTTTAWIVHHNRAGAQMDFPRSAWKNAGYADPVSAFETAFWATSQNEGKTLMASLSPDLQQKLTQDMTRAAMEELLSQDKNSASHINGVSGFHVVKSEVVSDNEVRLHLSIAGRQGEKIFKMKKMGNEWKMGDLPSGF